MSAPSISTWLAMMARARSWGFSSRNGLAITCGVARRQVRRLVSDFHRYPMSEESDVSSRMAVIAREHCLLLIAKAFAISL